METHEKYRTPIIWRATHEKWKKRWKIGFVLINSFYLAVIVSMGFFFIHHEKAAESSVLQKREFDTLKTKESIYTILRSKGVSLSQGLDIAEVTIQQSRELNLPMSLILAVMKKESMFTPHALSSQNAMGLMQVHPTTWEEYVGKLNLRVSAHAAFDPVTNIIVATHVLRDLYEYYEKTVKSEEEIWKSVLSAYYAGITSFSQTGLTESHTKYVADVNTFKDEFDKRF
ncbi:MAG: lytic transglycosylase domain-containing protein [Thermodesulfobacteriota bacterium]